MKYEHNFYKTSDGLLDIEFLFLDLGQELGWRGYVLNNINYKQFSNERSDLYTDTHLYIDENRHRYIDKDKDYPYICWTDTIYDIETMHKLAVRWSEITAYYIRNGGTFPEIQKLLLERGVVK